MTRTFWGSLAECTVPVEYDLLVLGLDQVIDNVRCRGVSARIAEPLATVKALQRISIRLYMSSLPPDSP